MFVNVLQICIHPHLPLRPQSHNTRGGDSEKQAEIRAKKRAFVKELESPTCTLRAHIVEQWKRANTMTTGKQKAIRDIVLNAVQPIGKNKYAIQVQHPIFEDIGVLPTFVY